MPQSFLPNLNWLRAMICPAIVFIAMSLDRGYQTDFWHHLARGRQIAQGGLAAANVDTFTFTVAGQPIRDANWLTQLAYFRLHELGGLPLVQFVNAVILAGAAALLVWTCRRACGSLPVAAGASVFALAGIWQTLLIRPQSVSLLLFVGLYALLVSAERRPRLLAVVPFIMALWANVHGGFPIGLILIAAFMLASAIEMRQLSRIVAPAACLFASILATLFNPYGLHVYDYVLTLSTRAAGRQVEEWMPPSMTLWVGKVFVVSIVALVALLILAPRRPRTRDVVVALCFLPLACASVRMVPWWLLAVAPVLAVMLRPITRATTSQQTPRPSLAAAGMFAFVCVMLALSTPWLQRFNPVLGRLRPASRPEADLQTVVDRLPTAADARVFTRLEWGEYLDWAGGRRCRTFMDGRIEIYPDDVWNEYHAVTSARADWQSMLDARGVDYLLLDNTYHHELIPRVDRSPRWARVTDAGPAVLYERRASGMYATTDDLHDDAR